jgi:hypothetical protein
MDEEKISSIMKNLSYLETEELKIHLENHDEDEWTGEAFEAMRTILSERGVDYPDPTQSTNDIKVKSYKITDYKDFFPKRIPGHLKEEVLSSVDLESSEEIILFISQSSFKKGKSGNVFTNEKVHLFKSGADHQILYQDIKHIYLLGEDENWYDIIIQLKTGGEIDAGMVIAQACPLAIRLLSDYTPISNIRKRYQILSIQRENETKNGIFTIDLLRDDSVLEDGYKNYLAFSAENQKVIIDSEGIQLPELQFFKSGRGEHLGRPASKGTSVPQMLMAVASSKRQSKKIAWDDLSSIFDLKELLNEDNPKTNDYVHFDRKIAVLFLRCDLNRKEFLIFEFFSLEEKELFLHKLSEWKSTINP